MTRYLRKQKIRFSVTTLALVSIILACVAYAQQLDLNAPFKELKYLVYKAEYAQAAHPGFLGGVSALFDGSAQETLGVSAGVPVFVYHGIVDKPDRFNMTESTFKDQMYALKKHGWSTLRLNEFYAFMAGTGSVPEKSFLLTFDDGRVDSFERADPILRALGFNAVMFVAAEYSLPSSDDQKHTYYLKYDDLRRMLDTGRWEIGSHAIQEHGGFEPVEADGKTANFLSNRKWLAEAGRLENDEEYAARMSREIGGSRQSLEEAFGIPVRAFSYPFGDYGQQTTNHPGAEGVIAGLIGENYLAAFRQVWPSEGEFAFNHPGDDPRRLKRIETPTAWTGEYFATFMEGSMEKRLPYADAFIGDSGWKGTWGEHRVEDGGLVLKARASTSGAGAFLDGTSAWKNYLFEAVLDRRTGSHVSLMARFRDSENYLACVFGEGSVRLDQVRAGVTTKLAEARFIDSASVGMRVKDGMADCLVNGQVATMGGVPDDRGGIGFKVWDSTFGKAELRVASLAVR